MTNAVRNTKFFQVFREISKLLNDNKIPVVALKGIHLSEFIYEDIALRPMADIDIMVKTKDLNKAVDLLYGMGFEIADVSQSLDNSFRKLYHYFAPIEISPLFNHYPTLFHPVFKINLDIHCSIISENSPFCIDIELLWKRVRIEKKADTKIWVLCPADFLLHLSIHASFQHLFDMGLRSLYDIAELIRYYQDEIDWNIIRKQSALYRTDRYLYITLRLIKELLNEPIPAYLLNELKPDCFDENVIDGFKRRLLKLDPGIYDENHLIEKYDDIITRKSMILNYLIPNPSFRNVKYLLPPYIFQFVICFYFRIMEILFRKKTKVVTLLKQELNKYCAVHIE
jgi:hypothetical protein